MKIQVKSNFNQFKRRFAKLPRLLDDAVQNSMKEILENMCREMKERLASATKHWFDNGGLEAVYQSSGNQDIEYTIEGNKGTILVGKNSSQLKLKDGRVVNPYLFIEFGYGIIGEENPSPKAYLYDWEYNVNNHEKAWVFMGINGDKEWTMGQKGFDFFYPVVDKYQKEWKKIVSNQILKLKSKW